MLINMIREDNSGFTISHTVTGYTTIGTRYRTTYTVDVDAPTVGTLATATLTATGAGPGGAPDLDDEVQVEFNVNNGESLAESALRTLLHSGYGETATAGLYRVVALARACA